VNQVDRQSAACRTDELLEHQYVEGVPEQPGADGEIGVRNEGPGCELIVAVPLDAAPPPARLTARRARGNAGTSRATKKVHASAAFIQR
jgi:hypothetical protein